MDVIAGLDAAHTVLTLTVELVKEILRAREDVRELPKDIEDFLEVVERLNPVLRLIQKKIQDEEDSFVKQPLQKVQLELLRASEKVDELRNKPQTHRSQALKTAIALFKRGDAKQRKNIREIKDAIEREREELVKALAIDTQLTVKEIQTDLNTFIHESPLPTAVAPPAIIARLDNLWFETGDDESHSVNVLIAEKNSDEFFIPGQHCRIRAGKDDRDQEGKRAAREGGWEVENSTKVQLVIKGDEAFFFYVLSYEKGLKVATDLEILFPRHANQKNKIDGAKRTFPNDTRYKYDPASLRVEKSASLRDGIIGQVLLYVVLSDKDLAPDETKTVDIDRIIEQISLEDDSEGIYVKRFLFDIK